MTIVRPEPALVDDVRRIQNILDNLAIYAALQSLCELRVFDRLAHSAATVDELAEWAASTMRAVNISRDYLARTLRAAWAHGWVLLGPEGHYHLSEVGESLDGRAAVSAVTMVTRAAPWRQSPTRRLELSARRTADRGGSVHRVVHRLDLYGALRLLCELRVPDRLEMGAATFPELRAWCGRVAAEHGDKLDLSRQALARLLRIGLSQDWLAATPAGFYRQTALGALLTSRPVSMRPAVLTYALRPWWEPLANMGETLRTGRPVALNGADSADSPLAVESAQAQTHIAAFHANRSTTMAAGIAAAIEGTPAQRISHVVTIGGNAILLDEILRRLPHLTGVHASLGEREGAIERLRGLHGREGRWKGRVGGDGFSGVSGPWGRPVFLLWEVMNTLAADEGLRLLASVAGAMDRAGSSSVLWLVQSVLPDTPGAHHALAQDLLQMTRTRLGRERTLREYTALLGKAGLRPTGIREAGPQLIITACRPSAHAPHSRAPMMSVASGPLVSPSPSRAR
ncbi:hypothetical protein ACWEJ6_49815 [Nonomuraea sp. NPDC004702]